MRKYLLGVVSALSLFLSVADAPAYGQGATAIMGTTADSDAGPFEAIRSLSRRAQVDAFVTGGAIVVTAVNSTIFPTSIAPYLWNQGQTTAGVADALIVATATSTRYYLMFKNESTTKDIGCRFDGTTSALNTAGTVTLPPYGVVIFEGTYVPRGAVRCISSAATQPLTIIAYPN